MEAQVHILCSHCEKVLVEVQKKKSNNDEVIDIENELSEKADKSGKRESSFDLKSESQDEEEDESSICEIKIDYSKNENSQLSANSGGEIQSKLDQQGPGTAERKVSGTFRKFEPTLDKLRMIAGYEIRKYYFLLR